MEFDTCVRCSPAWCVRAAPKMSPRSLALLSLAAAASALYSAGDDVLQLTAADFDKTGASRRYPFCRRPLRPPDAHPHVPTPARSAQVSGRLPRRVLRAVVRALQEPRA